MKAVSQVLQLLDGLYFSPLVYRDVWLCFGIIDDVIYESRAKREVTSLCPTKRQVQSRVCAYREVIRLQLFANYLNLANNI